jgi:hypothetical protein
MTHPCYRRERYTLSHRWEPRGQGGDVETVRFVRMAHKLTRTKAARERQHVQSHSITTNQPAIIALFRVINRYVGNLPPMPGVLPASR